LLTPKAAEEYDGKAAVAQAKALFRERRQNSARAFRQARESGVVTGFKVLASANDCDVCQSLQGKVFPLGSCTLEMLPPYTNCEYEDGCRATFTCVLQDEYEELLAKYPPDSTYEEKPKTRGIISAILGWIVGEKKGGE